MNVHEIIEVDSEKMGGTPCFTGTRVPIKNLFDYLDTGDSLETFLDDFPGKPPTGAGFHRLFPNNSASRFRQLRLSISSVPSRRITRYS
jgi:hypothetical protein